MDIAIVLAVLVAIIVWIVHAIVSSRQSSSVDTHGESTGPQGDSQSSTKEGAVALMCIGFVVGFAVVLGLEYLLLEALGARPRGIGWIAVPILAGVALARLAPILSARAVRSSASMWRTNKSIRLASVLGALWLVAVPAYWWLFEPYHGYRMYSDDYVLMFKVMLFPVVILVIAFIAYAKLVAPTPPPSDDKRLP